MFKKNTSVTGFPFALVSKTDGSAITTGTVTGYVTLDGGTQATIAATPAHAGNGQWTCNLAADEMNGDVVGLLFVHSSAITAGFTIRTASKLVSDLADAPAVTTPTNFASLSIDANGKVLLQPTQTGVTIPNVTLVGTCTTNTDMVDIADMATLTNQNTLITTIGSAGAGLTAIPYTGPATATLAAAVRDVDNTTPAAGSLGAKVNSAASAGDPWATDLPGAYAAGTAGYLVGTNIDAKVSTRSTFAGGAVASVTGAVGSVTAPVTVGENNDKAGYALATAPPTASVIATTLLGAAANGYQAGSVGSYLVSTLNAANSASSDTATIKAKTDNLPASPAAVGSAMTLADGSIASATFAAGATVPRVTLVDTCVTNTDMRGTDSAATATSLALVKADTAAILADTGTDGVVVASGSKTGYALAASGLDAISTAAPAGVATSFREMVVQTWRRLFKNATQTATELKTYADDNTTVLTTQAVSDDGSTQTQGAAV